MCCREKFAIFEMDNEVVFDDVLRPLIQRVLDGYNSLVIAYGQTGAGKTYTLLGKPKVKLHGANKVLL